MNLTRLSNLIVERIIEELEGSDFADVHPDACKDLREEYKSWLAEDIADTIMEEWLTEFIHGRN